MITPSVAVRTRREGTYKVDCQMRLVWQFEALSLPSETKVPIVLFGSAAQSRVRDSIGRSWDCEPVGCRASLSGA